MIKHITKRRLNRLLVLLPRFIWIAGQPIKMRWDEFETFSNCHGRWICQWASCYFTDLAVFFSWSQDFFLVCGFAQKEHYQKFDPDFLSKFKDLKSYGKMSICPKKFDKIFFENFPLLSFTVPHCVGNAKNEWKFCQIFLAD